MSEWRKLSESEPEPNDGDKVWLYDGTHVAIMPWYAWRDGRKWTHWQPAPAPEPPPREPVKHERKVWIVLDSSGGVGLLRGWNRVAPNDDDYIPATLTWETA